MSVLGVVGFLTLRSRSLEISSTYEASQTSESKGEVKYIQALPSREARLSDHYFPVLNVIGKILMQNLSYDII